MIAGSFQASGRKKVRVAPELSELVVYCQSVSFTVALEEMISNFQESKMISPRFFKEGWTLKPLAAFSSELEYPLGDHKP